MGRYSIYRIYNLDTFRGQSSWWNWRDRCQGCKVVGIGNTPLSKDCL